MDLVWDSNKSNQNEARHGVRFCDVEAVFFDIRAVTIEDLSAVGEQRFVTLERDGFARTLVVVYTYRHEEIRIISARRAASGEIENYEKGV